MWKDLISSLPWWLAILKAGVWEFLFSADFLIFENFLVPKFQLFLFSLFWHLYTISRCFPRFLSVVSHTSVKVSWWHQMTKTNMCSWISETGDSSHHCMCNLPDNSIIMVSWLPLIWISDIWFHFASSSSFETNLKLWLPESKLWLT